MDTKHGIRGAIAEVDENFENIKIISASSPDNRNMVLFPEKIGGKYVRLERPFTVYSRGRDRFDLWLSKSPDLVYWGESELVLAVEDVPYANDKIGPAAPPVKTDKGWLTLFHAVDIDQNRGKNGWEKSWKKRYCAGIMLLDLDDPSKIIGMYKKPLIAPENHYETEEGFRQQVIFPGGMILEDNGEVKIYYGASDTVECLATANVNDLIALCTEKRK
jgi:beta-1,4-mannooligosaccharide/beta-1,4-mannosyl-N-acetylglucosamine phosphorylase